jgi:DNA polymerase I-like protein with 3'-5' exonuclease and polymerase domains
MEAFPEVPDYLTLEMDVQGILTKQEIRGWCFDEEAAHELESSLRMEQEQLIAKARQWHPTIAGALFTPKRANKLKGYVPGAEFQKLIEFNPGSREHIAQVMEAQGWKPNQFTETGKAVIDETVLKEIGSEESLTYLRILELTKKLGMLTQGANAWLQLVKNGRIHHHCSVATNTHRCAHRKPNLGQVPSDDDCRRLFTASPGMIMVGADLAGIELRMLAHYLSRYDKGRYADILLNGDIHQVNADKIGISRKQVKTVTYAFLYGAGDQKIGLSYDPQLPLDEAKKKGKEIRAAFVDAVDGLGNLLSDVRSAAKRGYVRAIDKRKIKLDSPHKALNYLLQSSAAVIAKRWMVITDEVLSEHDLENTTHQLAFIHDELQYECIDDEQTINELTFTLAWAAVKAGEYYKLNILIDAEAKVGPDWAATH